MRRPLRRGVEEVRENSLEAKHAREKRILEHLEKLADLIEEAMTQFLPETSEKPIVELTLCSAEAQSKIVLRIDGRGKIADITDEPIPFPI